ncbi:MAG TPA: DUF6765 family protein, partial [Spirochaetota bacterium]
MEISSHYYALLAFCRARGFSRDVAEKIAHASQFVDDATINKMTIKNPRSAIECDTIADRKCFFDMATCHSYFRVKTFNYTSMIRNTSAFHFVPGCSGPTFSKKMRCKEESPVIGKILDASLKDADVIKFGMLLHVYADTFSHQGFSGLLSEVNNIDELASSEKVSRSISEFVISVKNWFGKSNIDKLFDKAVPGYGHAQAFTFPDEPYLVWSYEYDASEDMSEQTQKSGKINNPDRFTRAFEKMTGFLDSYLKLHPEYRDSAVQPPAMGKLYDTLVAALPADKRIDKWRQLMVTEKLMDKKDPALVFDNTLWLKKAFSNFDADKFDAREVYDVVLSDGFETSEWYSYYRAAKWYKNEFLK